MLNKLNQPTKQLEEIAQYLPEQTDVISSFIRQNMDANGNIQPFSSPQKKRIEEQLDKMTVPFYVIIATEDN